MDKFNYKYKKEVDIDCKWGVDLSGKKYKCILNFKSPNFKL